MRRLAVLTALAITALAIGVPSVGAQSQSSRGTCLAITNTLSTPVAVEVVSTSRISPNAAMSHAAWGQAGAVSGSWMILPGGPYWLVEPILNDPTHINYVVSQDGNFRIWAGPALNAGDPQLAVLWVPVRGGNVSFAFHPELTRGAACNGTEVVTVS